MHLSGFPGGTSGKEPGCQCRRHETQVPSLDQDQEDPLEEDMAAHPSISYGEAHRQRTLMGYSSWSPKESGITEAT